MIYLKNIYGVGYIDSKTGEISFYTNRHNSFCIYDSLGSAKREKTRLENRGYEAKIIQLYSGLEIDLDNNEPCTKDWEV